MKRLCLIIVSICLMMSCSDDISTSPGKVGWAIGRRPDLTAAIIFTDNSGESWEEPGDPSLWKGMNGNDISAVDEWTAWAAIKSYADLYRTTDGGDVWHEDVREVSGEGDIDDICAPNAEVVWAAQNQGNASGAIIRVRLVNGEVISKIMNPTDNYAFEDVTCFDEKTAWVVGMKPHTFRQDLPDGVILHTTDGSHWKSQPLPVKDVALWKVSFVGAHR